MFGGRIGSSEKQGLWQRIKRLAFTDVNATHSKRPSTNPRMAFSICCGLRGGSTEMVGTSSEVAP